MSFQDRAQSFALQKADELEKESRLIGICRSVDATESAAWLLSIAQAIREAAALDMAASEADAASTATDRKR